MVSFLKELDYGDLLPFLDDVQLVLDELLVEGVSLVSLQLVSLKKRFLVAGASFLPTSSLTPSVKYNPLIHISTT